MHILSGPWHAIAALSGRIDLSNLADSPPNTESAMCGGGISARQRTFMVKRRPLPSPQPFLRMIDHGFPQRLKPLPFAPGVLFYLGNIKLLSEPCVAIVGARKCSGKGSRFAHQLATDLTQSGAVTVSGLAYGIDQSVHWANPSRTIAVLGQGIQSSIDGSKHRLVKRILDANGLILSEFLPFQKPQKWTFPQRNRVVSGVSLGTVIVEATARSGSLITARQTLDQGRDLMVVPGHPSDPQSEGCNRLLFNGAAPVRHAEDVRNLLSLTPAASSPVQTQCEFKQAILSALKTGDSIDHIIATTGQTIHTVTAHVAELELTGEISRLSGDRITPRSST